MEKKYRIIENKWFDEYGNEHDKGYSVQRRKSFLGIRYWKTYTEQVCFDIDIYTEPIKFYKLKDAEAFVKEKLCTGTPIDKYTSKIIGEYGCKF